MWRLIKAEIGYNKYLIILSILFPLIFTIYSTLNVKVFQHVYFLRKYSWTIIVGFGLYFVIYAIWTMRIKEKRDRMHSIIPLKIKQISTVRYIFGVIPILVTVIYLQILRLFISVDWQTFVHRISVQLAMFFVFLISMLITRDLWNSFSQKNVRNRRLICGSTITSILLFSVLIIYLATISNIEHGTDEVLFWGWGLLLSFSSPFVFVKRDNYLT